MLTVKKTPLYKYYTSLHSFQSVLKQEIGMLSQIVALNMDFLLTICFTLCGRRGESLKPV